MGESRASKDESYKLMKQPKYTSKGAAKRAKKK